MYVCSNLLRLWNWYLLMLIFRWCHGSPVHRYGLFALQWIVEVNGKPTPDLDSFVDVTKVCIMCFLAWVPEVIDHSMHGSSKLHAKPRDVNEILKIKIVIYYYVWLFLICGKRRLRKTTDYKTESDKLQASRPYIIFWSIESSILPNKKEYGVLLLSNTDLWPT